MSLGLTWLGSPAVLDSHLSVTCIEQRSELDQQRSELDLLEPFQLYGSQEDITGSQQRVPRLWKYYIPLPPLAAQDYDCTSHLQLFEYKQTFL